MTHAMHTIKKSGNENRLLNENRKVNVINAVYQTKAVDKCRRKDTSLKGTLSNTLNLV